MNPYYFMIEVEPQHGNLLGAHVSRAITHIWVISNDLKEARETALGFLKSELWEVLDEKDAYLATQEKIDGLGEAEASSYLTAQSEGIHATFNYWHR